MLNEEEAQEVLQALHSGICGGHFSTKTTTGRCLGLVTIVLFYFQILRPMLDFVTLVRYLQESRGFQPFPLSLLLLMPLFRNGNGFKWTLATTNYLTRWVEAIPTCNATKEVIIKFIEDNIISRYGIVLKITTTPAKALHNIILFYLILKTIIHAAMKYQIQVTRT